MDSKLILYIAMSLDGYIAEKDGSIRFLNETPGPSPDLGYEKHTVRSKMNFHRINGPTRARPAMYARGSSSPMTPMSGSPPCRRGGSFSVWSPRSTPGIYGSWGAGRSWGALCGRT